MTLTAKRWLVAALAALSLFATACDATGEGLEEDAQQNLQEAEEGVEEAGDEAEGDG